MSATNKLDTDMSTRCDGCRELTTRVLKLEVDVDLLTEIIASLLKFNKIKPPEHDTKDMKNINEPDLMNLKKPVKGYRRRAQRNKRQRTKSLDKSSDSTEMDGNKDAPKPKTELDEDGSQSDRKWSSNHSEAKNEHQEICTSECLCKSPNAGDSALVALGDRMERVHSEPTITFSILHGKRKIVGRRLSRKNFGRFPDCLKNASSETELTPSKWLLKPADLDLTQMGTSKDVCITESDHFLQARNAVPNENQSEESLSQDTKFRERTPPDNQEVFSETESEDCLADVGVEHLEEGDGQYQAVSEQQEMNTDPDSEQMLRDQKVAEFREQRQQLANGAQVLPTNVHELIKPISRLETENMTLNIQIQELQQELSAAKGEIRVMKGRLERSELRATNLKKQLQAEENRRKTSIQKQKQVLSRQAFEAEEKAEEAKQKQFSLEAQCQRLETLLSEVSRRASIAEQDREAMDRQHCLLRSMSADLRRELDSTHLARHEALISSRELEYRLHESERRRAESIEALDRVRKESLKMRHARDDAEEELKQLHEAKSSLIIQNIKLNEVLAEQKNDLSDVQSALYKKQEKEQLLMAKLEDTESRLRTEEKKTEQLELYTKSLEKTIKELREKLSALSKSCSPQQQRVEEMEQLLSLMKEQLRSEQEKSQAAVRDFRIQSRKLRDCTLLLDQKNMASLQLEEKFKKLEAAHEKLKLERDVMEDEIAKFKVQRRALSRDLESLSETNEILEREVNSLRLKLKHQDQPTWLENSETCLSPPNDLTSPVQIYSFGLPS
ncbi:hypothetical protein SprV_0301254800 [Sparganum proliferum]